MKKLVILIGDAETVATYDGLLMTVGKSKTEKAFAGRLSYNEPLEDIMSEIFSAPIRRFPSTTMDVTINENHLRRFFGKMNRGIFSITNYIGKRLDSACQILDYFENRVGATAFGGGWLGKMFLDKYNNLPAGVYLVSDALVPQARILQALLPNEAEIVHIVGDGQTKLENALAVEPKTNDRATKKSITELLEQLNNKWKGITNDEHQQ